MASEENMDLLREALFSLWSAIILPGVSKLIISPEEVEKPHLYLTLNFLRVETGSKKCGKRQIRTQEQPNPPGVFQVHLLSIVCLERDLSLPWLTCSCKPEDRAAFGDF